MVHVLILTMMIGINNGGNSSQGSGGIAMGEFDTKFLCEEAATKWLKETKMEQDRWSTVSYLKHSALCMPKSKKPST